MSSPAPRNSLRNRLLVGILLPTLLVVAVNTVGLYRQALKAADVAYDRTLLATAKSLGDLLEVGRDHDHVYLKSTLLYSALEPFEADNRSRLYYKVTGFDGETVSGFASLPSWRGALPQRGPYAALVDFYDDHYEGTPVRVAVLLQPVTWSDGQAMAVVQVAETLELRQTLARSLLQDTLWRQGGLLVLVAGVVWVMVHRATRPIRRLSQSLRARAEGDLTPVTEHDAPRELAPLVDAMNDLMLRLGRLLEHHKRFVRDASHQLRTPLAVLTTQVQSAQRGDVGPEQALAEISLTVGRATELANQMLALAKVEQMRQQHDAPVSDWGALVRNVALDLSALIVERCLDFELDADTALVRSHAWALRELTRNLLHNAIRHCPAGGSLLVTLHRIDRPDGPWARLCVTDSGPGLDDVQREHLFQPFAARGPQAGSGIGLAICHDIVTSLNGQIELRNRMEGSRCAGLDAIVHLPMPESTSEPVANVAQNQFS